MLLISTFWVVVYAITSVCMVCYFRHTQPEEHRTTDRASRMDWREVLFLLVLFSAFGSILAFGTWAFFEMLDILLHFGGLG